MDVNVFDYKICLLPDNADISRIDFSGIGEDLKKSITCNWEKPYKEFPDDKISVNWSITDSAGENTDTSEIVKLSNENQKTATIVPLKIGKTYLKCVFSVDDEVLGESVIPIIVSGIESADSETVITNNIINMSKTGTKTAKIKYTFGEEITSASYEAAILPSNNFAITKNSDNTFTIKYDGTSEVTAEVTIIVKTGNQEYKGTIKINIS